MGVSRPASKCDFGVSGCAVGAIASSDLEAPRRRRRWTHDCDARRTEAASSVEGSEWGKEGVDRAWTSSGPRTVRDPPAHGPRDPLTPRARGTPAADPGPRGRRHRRRKGLTTVPRRTTGTQASVGQGPPDFVTPGAWSCTGPPKACALTWHATPSTRSSRTCRSWAATSDTDPRTMAGCPGPANCGHWACA